MRGRIPVVRRGGVPWEWGAVCPCRGLLAQRGNAGGRVLMPRAHGRGWYREKEIIDQADNDLERGGNEGWPLCSQTQRACATGYVLHHRWCPLRVSHIGVMPLCVKARTIDRLTGHCQLQSGGRAIWSTYRPPGDVTAALQARTVCPLSLHAMLMSLLACCHLPQAALCCKHDPLTLL